MIYGRNTKTETVYIVRVKLIKSEHIYNYYYGKVLGAN